jgi:hypothetical protein
MAKRAGKGSGGPANFGGSGSSSSNPQKPIPGSKSSGPPASMRKALAKKPRGGKGTSFPGTYR